jgi:uncharacterized protein YfaS (alpha-2-macroglobulin family)
MFLAMLMAGWGCGRGADAGGDAPYSPFVDAFTSGMVSRFTPVNVVFNSVPEGGRISETELRRRFRITPSIRGSLSMLNDRTVRFVPEEAFARDTEYSIRLRLSGWFDTDKQSEVFSFGFRTLPLELRVEQSGLAQGMGKAVGIDSNAREAESEDEELLSDDIEGISMDDQVVYSPEEPMSRRAITDPDSWDGFYDITYTIETPDREDDKTVEALVRASEDVHMSWLHSSGSNRHILTVNVQSDPEQGRKLRLSVAPNRLGLREQTLAETYIPSRNEFAVYFVRYAEEPERCVEITFTRPLNPKQSLEGLATIEDNNNGSISIEGNVLRLYPDANCRGLRQVFLNSAITSKDGARLATGEGADEIVYTVDISPARPAIEFAGEGNIIPLTGDLIVPFRAVHLRGVIVRVIKIREENIGQFLQTNDLEGSSYLMQVGQLAARKTLFFDEQGGSLSRWGTYAVRLNELITPEPGAIYRLILSASPELSVFICDSLSEKPGRESILAADAQRFREEAARFDGTHSEYYYFGNVFGDSNYYYYYDDDEEGGLPEACNEYFYYRLTKERNILATNLGLTAKQGSDGRELTFLVHNLLTTHPEGSVSVEAFDYRHSSLGSAVTASDGQARISLRDSRRPFYVTASQGRQRAYLRIDPGSALSLSAFDVSGAHVQKGIKAFIYGERGVWRPGDTLHLGFMLNDKLGSLPRSHPVSLELFTPQGQSYARKTQTEGTLGLYAFGIPTDPDAPTGAWNVSVQVGGLTFEKRIRIESIKPNRLKIGLTLPKFISRDREAEIPIHAEWLNGATARNLKYDVQTMFSRSQTTFDGYADYVFDDPAKSYSVEEVAPIEGETDSAGKGTVSLLFDNGNYAPGMLTAHFTTRVYEESGEFSIDAAVIPYSPYPSYVGIKSPLGKGEPFLATGREHNFRVALLSEQGKPASARLEVRIWKTRWYWWWDESPGETLANYISNSQMQLVRTTSVKTDSKGHGSLALNMSDADWGTYYIEVKDPEGGHSTGLMAYFDSPHYSGPPRRDAGSDSPTRLQLSIDKESYSPGEKIALSFPSPEGSRAVVSIENGSRVISIREYPCGAGETLLHLDVTPEMEPNAYIYIMLLQPYRHEANDLPVRMYGVVPFRVSSADSRLHPIIQTASEYKPDEAYRISVSEEHGRSMAYTLAVVDEGLLDLTRFRTPDPWQSFNAREAHGVSTWDVYNHILGAYGGRIQQIFGIGGDDALAKGPKAVVNRFKPVVRFAGPFLLGKGETRTHTLDMPNYNGRVRVMVVAGDGHAYGNAEKSVMVRKPVMLLGSLPRVIGTEEEMLVPATVFATEDKIGTVRLSISCSNNMQVIGQASQEININEKGDRTLYFRLKTGSRPGAGRVSITATAKGERSSYETDIELRSVARSQVSIESVAIEPGKSWKGSLSLPGADGTNSLALEVSALAPINLGWRLSGLLGYPHGCLEQITSKAFPQLYLKDFATLTEAQAASAETAVKATLSHYRSYFDNGRLSYWPNTHYVNEWAGVYALHFMTEAASKGYSVPSGIKSGVSSTVRKAARNWRAQANASGSEELTQAYRLYVLALEQQSEIGAMNRLRERNPANPTSKWLLSAAYALAGRKDVAEELMGRTHEQSHQYSSHDETFGSAVRDYGICLQTLVLMNKGQEAAQISRKIADRLSSSDHLSTQEVAFSLIGMSAYIKRYGNTGGLRFSYKYNGLKEVSAAKSLWMGSLFSGGPSTAAAEITNKGQATVFVRLIGEGIPAQGEEKASSSGVEVSVAYMNGTGQAVKPERLKQGMDFSAVVTVKNLRPEPVLNLVVSQVFPAGWEILNTRFAEQEGADGGQDNNISYQDIRDDRVYSYINRLDGNRQITFAIKLAAVYAGTFHLPPTYCEAMYNHLIQSNTAGATVAVEK